MATQAACSRRERHKKWRQKPLEERDFSSSRVRSRSVCSGASSGMVGAGPEPAARRRRAWEERGEPEGSGKGGVSVRRAMMDGAQPASFLPAQAGGGRSVEAPEAELALGGIVIRHSNVH